MIKHLITLLLLLFCLSIPLLAQEEEKKDTLKEGWNTSLAIGLDLSQLFQLNPKQGAGQNRFGFGGALNTSAIYKKNRLLWESGFAWQFGVQKLGAGVLVLPLLNRNEKVPFQKTIDELRLGSKLGYALDQKKKWYLTGAFTFLSLVAPSYPGPETYPGNFLRNFADTILNSKFMNPANITFSAGIEFKPNDKFSLYFSPLGARWIVVADDDVAKLGIHGNPVRGDRNDEGFYTDFDNVDNQLGAHLRAAYNTKFWKERMYYRTILNLFSNYLRNPQNIDVDWTNEVGITLFKGLTLSVLLNAYYDDDVLVQITDLDAPNGVRGLGKRVSLTQQLLIGYKVDF